MSPPYQATPTDQREWPEVRSHMVTAPSPESRKRRRSRKATTTATTRAASRTRRSVVTRGVLRHPARERRSGLVAGGPQSADGPAGGGQCLGVVAGLIGSPQG